MTFDIIVHVMAVFVRGSRSVYAGGITAVLIIFLTFGRAFIRRPTSIKRDDLVWGLSQPTHRHISPRWRY